MKKLALIILFCIAGKAYAQNYRSEEVTFTNDTTQLAGTLSFPKGEGPFPVVVLISGSGAQDRNSDLMGFKVFKIMADSLNEAGIAVLRYDERGVGKSTGKSVGNSTSAELAEDVLSAVHLLSERKDISSIGMLGHSEGGIIAPMVEVQSEEVDFLILLAGPGIPGKEVIATQQKAMLAQNPTFTEDYIEEAIKVNSIIMEMMSETSLSEEQAVDSIASLLKESIKKLPDAIKNSITDPDLFSKTQANNAYKQFQSEWIKYFISYDPLPTLKKVDEPILLLFGGKDLQVTEADNRPSMEQVLKEAGHKQVTIKVFPEANHLFQKANTGSPMEYATLDKAFISGLLPLIADWIKTEGVKK